MTTTTERLTRDDWVGIIIAAVVFLVLMFLVYRMTQPRVDLTETQRARIESRASVYQACVSAQTGGDKQAQGTDCVQQARDTIQ